jgi:radical SAM protein with 4Fe4S-binding SPASM domain
VVRPAPAIPPRPGLYAYEIREHGGQVRLHLRVEEDGSGVLFRDVSDVVHLNSTATQMAKLALDGTSQNQACATLLASYGGVSREQLRQELAGIYDLVASFSTPGTGCPTCALTGLERRPLFSTPVSAPFKADLALTYGCNNRCAHCYNEPQRYDMASLTREQWFRVIDVLHARGVPHLIVTGGEATLHPDLLDIVAYANGLGHVVGLNTNGRRLAHRPFVDQLVTAGLDHVQITLGSSRPAMHDATMGARSFDQTVGGIRNALNAGLHTITNTTLTRANQDHAPEIVHFLHGLGLRTFAMNGMINAGGGTVNPDAIPVADLAGILVQIRDTAADLGMNFLWYTPTEYCRLSPLELELGARRCNAAEYSICIEPNGDVLPCQSYYVSAGNILRDPWDAIWRSELFRSFRDRVQDPRRTGLPERCWDCPDLPLCAGGCRLEREAGQPARIDLLIPEPVRQVTTAANGRQSPAVFPAGRRGSGRPITDSLQGEAP